MRTTTRLTRFGLALALLAAVAACAPGQRACRFNGQFAQLASQIPDVVGACQGAEMVVAEMGETLQPTTTGQLIARSVDGLVVFSDTSQSYVMDASGQVHARGLRERFAWEFNGDGFPLVGESDQDVDGACPGEPLRVLAVENFYADLARQLGGQCVSVTAILSDPSADPHEFQPGTSDVLAYQHAQLVIQNGLGYDDFSDRILATLGSQPVLIDAGELLGLQAGDNPHVWYSPADVDQIRAAINTGLEHLAPEYAPYFEAQSSAVNQRMATYRELVGQVSAQFAGTAGGLDRDDLRVPGGLDRPATDLTTRFHAGDFRRQRAVGARHRRFSRSDQQPPHPRAGLQHPDSDQPRRAIPVAGTRQRHSNRRRVGDDATGGADFSGLAGDPASAADDGAAERQLTERPVDYELLRDAARARRSVMPLMAMTPASTSTSSWPGSVST